MSEYTYLRTNYYYLFMHIELCLRQGSCTTGLIIDIKNHMPETHMRSRAAHHEEYKRAMLENMR